MYENAGVTPGTVELKDRDKFQAILDDYQIRVVSAKHLSAIIYRGKCNSRNIIFVYLGKERDHYDVTVYMKGFIGGVYYCTEFEKSFNTSYYKRHTCS